MSILKLVADDGFIAVNIGLIKAIGLDEAIIVGEMARKYNYWEKENGLVDGYFFITHEDIEADTGLKRGRQETAIKNLQQLNILLVDKKGGFNRSNYYKLNEELLIEMLIYDKTPIGKKYTDASVKNLPFEPLKNHQSNGINFTATNTIITNTEILKQKNTNKEVSAEADNLKSKGYKNIISYINSLNFNDNTIKDDLINWYENVSKGRVSVGQLQDKLKDLAIKANNNEALMKEAIKSAYIDNHMAFYPKQNNFKSNTEIHLAKPKVEEVKKEPNWI